MPFRLLGLVVDPNRAGELCGHSFAHYAASGVEVSLVCASGGPSTPELRTALRLLGVRELVLLDYSQEELAAGALKPILAELLVGLRPHVVVAPANHETLRQSVEAAFALARGVGRGSAALPAKLYFRTTVAQAPAITTAVRPSLAQPPDLFLRAFPAPWVTGVLERDLFSGIPAEQAPAEEPLAA